jgi:hypothetical protein
MFGLCFTLVQFLVGSGSLPIFVFALRLGPCDIPEIVVLKQLGATLTANTNDLQDARIDKVL